MDVKYVTYLVMVKTSVQKSECWLNRESFADQELPELYIFHDVVDPQHLTHDSEKHPNQSSSCKISFHDFPYDVQNRTNNVENDVNLQILHNFDKIALFD